MPKSGKMKRKKRLTPADIQLSTAPDGFTGKVKFVSMTPSGMQAVIIGKGKEPSSKDKKFYIENFGVRQLASATNDFKSDIRVTVFTGKEGWNKNMMVSFNLPDKR